MAWRNAAHQQTINQEVYDRKGAPHTFMKNQWVLEKSFDYLHKNTKLAAKYKGPFQIVRILPHNNVEIRLSTRRKSIVHANKLKPYHSLRKENFKPSKIIFVTKLLIFKNKGVKKNLNIILMKKNTLQKIILSHQKNKSLEKKKKKVKAQKNFCHLKEKGKDQEKQKRKHFQHSKT
jgi:hypothetical protein